MRYLYKIALIFVIALSSNELRADNLFNSLKAAYLNNPKLNAERASVRSSNENQKGALSEFMPNITVSGYISEQDNTQGSESNFKPSEQSLLVEQKIFQGLGGVANLKKKNLNTI